MGDLTRFWMDYCSASSSNDPQVFNHTTDSMSLLKTAGNFVMKSSRMSLELNQGWIGSAFVPFENRFGEVRGIKKVRVIFL